MRSIRNPRLERGEVRIEDIALDHKCRDDLIAILIGIQYLYLQEDLRERLFALLDKYILPGTNRKVGRPGMDYVEHSGIGTDQARYELRL